MLSVPCGVLPSSPLVWAGPSIAVTGETGVGVASPQKSSELNKPPSTHKDFISFSVCLWAAPKEVPLPHTKKEEEVVTQSCSGSVQIFLSSSLTWLVFFIPSPPSLSSYSLVSFVVVVQPVQTSSRSALLLICQPLIAPSSLFLSVFLLSAICFWVLL